MFVLQKGHLSVEVSIDNFQRKAIRGKTGPVSFEFLKIIKFKRMLSVYYETDFSGNY